jgi:hypothetical protein
MRAPLAPILAVTALALLAPRAAHAQGSAQIGVAADISTTALAVSQLRNLNFGNILPGVAATVDPHSTTLSGAWQILGNKNAEIAMTLTLPTQLTTGTWTLPISFGATSGCGKQQQNQTGCTVFNPSVGLIARIRNSNPPNNTFHVWIGGTVTPSLTQHTGMYLGNITLSVVYTGN